MKTTLLSSLAVTILLTSCETKRSETKDQLVEAGQDTAVMARDSRSASTMAYDNWDMTTAKLNDVKFSEITSSGVIVRGDSAYNIYSVEEKVLFDTEIHYGFCLKYVNFLVACFFSSLPSRSACIGWNCFPWQ